MHQCVLRKRSANFQKNKITNFPQYFINISKEGRYIKCNQKNCRRTLLTSPATT